MPPNLPLKISFFRRRSTPARAALRLANAPLLYNAPPLVLKS
jgi:hypothetical protein